MSNRENTNTPLLVAGILVLAFGAWAFLGALDWWGVNYVRQALDLLGRIGWPLIIVAAGVLLIVSASKPGGLSARTSGKTFRRSRSKRVISGVFGGLSDYLDVDVALLRVIGVVLLLTNAAPIGIAYLIATIAVPEEPVSTSGGPQPAPPIPPIPPQA